MLFEKIGNRLARALATALIATQLVPFPAFAGGVLDMNPAQVNANALPAARTDLNELCGYFDSLPKEDATHNGKSLKEQCEAFTWAEDNQLQMKCKLREVALNGQAPQFCKARTASLSAKKHLKAAVAQDAIAAGLCMAEAYSFPFPTTGVCGTAAMAVALAETARAVDQYRKGASTAGGGYKIDDQGNPQKKDNPGILSVATNAVPVAASLMIAKQYFSCQKEQDISRQANSKGQTLAEERKELADFREKRKNFKDQVVASQGAGGCSASHTFQGVDRAAQGFSDDGLSSPVFVGGADKLEGCTPSTQTLFRSTESMEKSLKNLKSATGTCSRRIQAFNAGLFFMGLAAIRGINYNNANKTSKMVEEQLYNLVGQGSSAAGAITNNGNTGFGKQVPTAYRPTSESSAITSQDLPGGPESMLLGNTPLGNKARDVANKMGLGDDRNFDRAMSGGAAGLAAQVAAASGAPKHDLLAEANSMKPYLASIDTSTSVAVTSGGGGSKGGSSSPASDLNLAGILGGGEGGPGAAPPGVSVDAFRAPARVGGVFHENSNLNLFQIVSGKLEYLQKDLRIPVR